MRIWLFLAVLGASTSAVADDVPLAPGPDGVVSTWLALGPFPSRGRGTTPVRDLGALRGVLPRQGERATTPDGQKPWIAFGSRDAWTNATDVPGHGEVVYLACVLEAARPTAAYLSIATNRGSSVFLNDALLYERTDGGLIRPDFLYVPMELRRGPNVLVLRVPRTAPRNWGAFVRLVDRQLRPLRDLVILLPGVDLGSALATFAEVTLRREPSPRGFELQASARFPGGGPRASAVPLSLAVGDLGATANFDAPASGRVTLAYEPPRDGTVEARVGLGSTSLELPIVYRARRHEALRIAADGLGRAASHVAQSSLDSVAYSAQRLADLIADADLDHDHLDAVAEEVAELGAALGRGEDPYRSARGALRKAYRSELDGSLQPYSVYVPTNYRAERSWPLTVALHGMRGTPHRELRYTFGFDLRDGEAKEHAERYLPALPNPGMLVLSAHGRGDASFKSAGEIDVMDAISSVGAYYRVDPNRVYITGPSMGGIGSGGIPLRNPSIFAAAAPLCGYHSYRVYNQVIGRPRTSYEDFLIGNFSNADWAENGEQLPMRIVHGTRDRPISSEVLVNRYRQLRYDVRYDLLEAGHNVWGATYENGGIFDWFRPHARDPFPRHVLFKSSRLRHRAHHWVTVDDAVDYGAWVQIEATAREGNLIEVRTSNVAAFTLTPGGRLIDGAEPVRVAIDGGSPLEVASGPLSFVREGSGYRAGRLGPTTVLRKRPGLAGPIHDMQYEPVTFVYGTQDPAQTDINRTIAYKLREVRDNATAFYPVVADTELEPEDVATRSLALIGNPSSNSVLARLQERLPIRFEPGAIVVDGRRHEGDDVGVMFIYPNPENPERYILVVAGNTALGTAYSDHLPELVPDFVVFDHEVLPAQGEVLIADGALREAGFFDNAWQLRDH